jgi:hypothetical protein
LLLLSLSLPARVIFRLPNVFVVLGVLGLFGSPICLSLSVWEMLRYQRSWRTILAFVILSVATVASLLTVLYVVRLPHDTNERAGGKGGIPPLFRQ